MALLLPLWGESLPAVTGSNLIAPHSMLQRKRPHTGPDIGLLNRPITLAAQGFAGDCNPNCNQRGLSEQLSPRKCERPVEAVHPFCVGPKHVPSRLGRCASTQSR